jgi:hypothetical protein
VRFLLWILGTIPGVAFWISWRIGFTSLIDDTDTNVAWGDYFCGVFSLILGIPFQIHFTTRLWAVCGVDMKFNYRNFSEEYYKQKFLVKNALPESELSKLPSLKQLQLMDSQKKTYHTSDNFRKASPVFTQFKPTEKFDAKYPHLSPLIKTF